MKKIFLITLLGFMFFSCTSKWEYKIVSVKGEEQETKGTLLSNKFDVSDESLNLFGKDGWELVGIYENTETVYPNFGNEDYHTGIKTNTRTAEINFVFKRKK
jgi:hypothetical protein